MMATVVTLMTVVLVVVKEILELSKELWKNIYVNHSLRSLVDLLNKLTGGRASTGD